ncbi:MAG TPA: hypothetical protein VN047_22030 [Sphingopyxis sp.]|uniref:hypothetical protein n=1 Tax=Sphingopyxis sp. TaxID=1908224 RepID=UPI002B599C9D|nr:hypothetical protein [Sphingopyxis sp.]HWW59584.1 hypothetical protein [Sphingopyxis sp.]
MRSRLASLFALAPLLLLLAPHTADARLPPLAGSGPRTIAPQPVRETVRYRCDVERKLARGTVSLTRLYTEAGEYDAGDFMRWFPAHHDPQRAERPLDLELSYIWEPGRQPAVAPREIEVELRVGLDDDLPEVAWIRMQRPFPVKPHGIVGSTALATQVFPYSSHDPKNGHGELPLGDLLAYAEGHDALGWTLVRPSDKLGGDRELAHGTIDIAALRAAVAALPALRSALAAKTGDPKARCERVLWPDFPEY